MPSREQKRHIILVHGVCHGAWCWYKLIPLLEAAGHRVTALDMAASGINSMKLLDLASFEDYTQPLLDALGSLDASEKVILMGHSQGGLNISLAMEMFPEKILVAVYVTAILPDLAHPPSYWPLKFIEESPPEKGQDTVFSTVETPGGRFTSMSFGPISIATKLYASSPPEDVELAKVLVRPSILFLEEEKWRYPLSEKGFGSVKKVYILCPGDKTILINSQRRMTESCGVDGVKELQGSDHMAMISKPHQLSQLLLEIVKDYSNVVTRPHEGHWSV